EAGPRVARRCRGRGCGAPPGRVLHSAARRGRASRMWRRRHATAAAELAPGRTRARWRLARPRADMSADELRRDFLRYVCQTSRSPLGIVIARAAGTSVWDADGREYLDLLSGMGVANVGHANPEVIAAIAAQAARHLHVMVYGEVVQESQVELARQLAALAPG